MSDSHEAETDEQTSRFNLTFSLDRDGFMRRTCSSCGRDFKAEANASDFATALQPYFREAGLEIGVREEEENGGEKEYLRCPYCSHRAESSEMLTEELVNYTERLILREYLLPMINQHLAQTADSFGSGTRNSPVSVSLEHDPGVRAVRPISGPEPPDMTIVHLLCCSKRIKVSHGWYKLSHCPYCDTRVRLYN